MYKMKLGNNISITSIIIIILCNVIAVVLACHLFIGCCSVKHPKEGFTGAPIDYQMGQGIPGDNYNAPLVHSSGVMNNLYQSLQNNHGGPVPPKGLFLFQDNKFKPECCYTPQQYSSSSGCACISPEQMKFIASRGGNNTIPH